jgi:hypothetical protein
MKGNIEQAWADQLKAYRASVRLKYSIMADNELNATVDTAKKKFFKNVQQGKLQLVPSK